MDFSIAPVNMQHLAAAIRIVAPFAANKKDCRFYLQGVQVRQVGEDIQVTSTNGSYLARATIKAAPGTSPEGPVDGVVIPTDDIKILHSFMNATKNPARFGCTSDATLACDKVPCQWSAGSSTSSGSVIIRQYPDADRVLLPKTKKASTELECLSGLAFDAAYMMTVSKAFEEQRKANKARYGSMKIWTSGSEKGPMLCAYSEVGPITLQVTLMGQRS